MAADGGTSGPAVSAQKTLDVMRLGWVIAEAVGRYRLGEGVRLRGPGIPVDGGRALPLANERTPAEQRIRR